MTQWRNITCTDNIMVNGPSNTPPTTQATSDGVAIVDTVVFTTGTSYDAVTGPTHRQKGHGRAT